MPVILIDTVTRNTESRTMIRIRRTRRVRYCDKDTHNEHKGESDDSSDNLWYCRTFNWLLSPHIMPPPNRVMHLAQGFAYLCRAARAQHQRVHMPDDSAARHGWHHETKRRYPPQALLPSPLYAHLAVHSIHLSRHPEQPAGRDTPLLDRQRSFQGS